MFHDAAERPSPAGYQTTFGGRFEGYEGLPVYWIRDHKRQTVMTTSHARVRFTSRTK